MLNLKFKTIFALLSISLLVIHTDLMAQEIYVYREPDGVIHFTSRKPSTNNYSVFNKNNNISKLTYRLHSNTNYKAKKLYLDELREEIRSASQRYGMSENLIRAVIHAESAFNQNAKSHKGALGLMQLMPFNLEKFGVDDPFEPSKNIDAGVALLSDLYNEYDGDLELVLAAYNAGQGAVQKHGGVPPYKETQEYIKKVKYLYKEYASNFTSHVYRG